MSLKIDRVSLCGLPVSFWLKTCGLLGRDESAKSLSLTCREALKYLEYLPRPNLSVKKHLWIDQTKEPEDSARVKIYENYWGGFINHSDDDAPTSTFARTMFETFWPGRGAYETKLPSQEVIDRIYQPSLCAKPNGNSYHLTILWGGHACFKFEYKYSEKAPPIKIVVDPNNSSKIPLVLSSCYRRMIPAGLTDEMIDEDEVDIGVVTHNHTDHCDEEMIEKLSKNKDFHLLGPEKTPKRLEKKLGCHGLEHKWWDRTTVCHGEREIIHFTSLPAHHSSAGRDVSTQEEGWCGWKIAFRTPEDNWFTINVMGDTACHNDLDVKGSSKQHHKHHVQMFNEIKQELGHINLALVPIDPPKGEESTHLNVYQSANLYAHTLTDVDYILPMHYGTWCWGKGCSPDNLLEARDLFDQAMADKNLTQKVFQIQVGQSKQLF